MIQTGNPISAAGGRSNLRTALVLLSIALIFFVGVIVNRWLFK
ncbi:MAG: cytochrome oxidase small assembly protein [Lautropia sp.]